LFLYYYCLSLKLGWFSPTASIRSFYYIILILVTCWFHGRMPFMSPNMPHEINVYLVRTHQIDRILLAIVQLCEWIIYCFLSLKKCAVQISLEKGKISRHELNQTINQTVYNILFSMLAFSALMYSVIGVILSKVRGAEDELNTLVAATTTGLLYKSTGTLCSCFQLDIRVLVLGMTLNCIRQSYIRSYHYVGHEGAA